MKERLKLQDGESIKFIRSTSKGSMAQEDINEYEVLDSEGKIVGRVVHKDHTAIRGFHRTQSVRQTGIDGTVIVDESWSGD